MSPLARRRWVLVASFGAVLAFTWPSVLLAEKLRGGIGGLLVTILLLASRVVPSTASGGDHHEGLIGGVSLLIYGALYGSTALLPHLALKGHARAHDLVIGLVAFGYLLLMTWRFPIRGLPL